MAAFVSCFENTSTNKYLALGCLVTFCQDLCGQRDRETVVLIENKNKKMSRSLSHQEEG